MKSAQSQGRTATSPEQATNHGGLDIIDLGLIPYREAVRVRLEQLEAVADWRAGFRPGGFRLDDFRLSGCRLGGFRVGNFRPDGLRPGDVRKRGFRASNRLVNFRPGGFRFDSFRQDGHRPGDLIGFDLLEPRERDAKSCALLARPRALPAAPATPTSGRDKDGKP